jgi:hypothetical protein
MPRQSLPSDLFTDEPELPSDLFSPAPSAPTRSPDQMSDLERTVLGLPPKPQPSAYESAWNTAASYVPQTAKDAWDWLWAPKSDLPSRAARPLAEQIIEYGQQGEPMFHMPEFMTGGAKIGPMEYAGHYTQALGDTLSALTSPGNIGLTLATGGAGLAGRTAAVPAIQAATPTIARGLAATGRGLATTAKPLGYATMAHGAQAMADPEATLFERGLGALEMYGGRAATKPPRAAKAPVPTPEELPVRQSAAPIEPPVLPHEFSPDIPMTQEPVLGGTSPIFEGAPRPAPTRKVSLEMEGGRTIELEFVDPETGATKPASQAKPGDVPTGDVFEAPTAPEVAPRRAGGRMGAPNLGPAIEAPPAAPAPTPAPTKFANIKEWMDDLVKSESGELDVDALIGRAEPEAPARRVDPESVSRENRSVIDDMPDEALRGFIQRQSANPNYTEPGTQGRAMLDYARDVEDTRIARNEAGTRLQQDVEDLGLDRLTPEQASDAIRYYESRGRTELVDYLTGRYQRTRTAPRTTEEAFQGRITDFERASFGKERPIGVKFGKTLEEVEAGKRTPALERLGKLIGEERAQKLTTGERVIEFSEKAPRYKQRKKLDPYTVKTWSEWGDSQIKDVDVDAGKPGLSVRPSELNIFPKAFEIEYRDASGKPVGVLKTDMAGEGITTLAVKSDVGLRRGKIAFEMLKEAFDRGVSEPSGTTSDLTNNLIERVKRLVKSEGGEIDVDVILNQVNKLMDKLGNSSVIQAARKFMKAEEGHVDMDRLKALFAKQQDGTITADELAEARSMAQEAKAAPTKTPQQRFNLLNTNQQKAVNNLLNEGKSIDEALAAIEGGPRQPAGIPRVQGPRRTRARMIGPRRPRPARQPQLGPAPFRERKIRPLPEQGMLSQIWNIPRSLQSIDLPGVTSAAFRQARPLAFTRDWFKAWGSAVKAFGSKEALDQINAKIASGKYFKPRIKEVKNRAGQVVRYQEIPSIAEELGVNVTDMLNRREEAIVSSLAERIPGYGRYVKASNRAYTAFLNDLRAAKFTQMMEGAEAIGRSAEVDVALGKKMADFVNNATGRGSLKFLGDRINLEPIAAELGGALYSPRALSARLGMMNPYNYTKMDPLVRKEYWKSLARIGVSWGGFASLAALSKDAHVSFDPNNADFGKIRIGNTRIDPGAGFQQLLVLTHRELPKVLGGGETVSSAGRPGQPGKATPLGSSKMAATRRSLPADYVYNQLNPSLRFIADMLGATQEEPFDLTDQTLQQILPMYVTDIAEAAAGDMTVANFFAPLLRATALGIPGSIGFGSQTYGGRGGFNKPEVTPFIEKVLQKTTGQKVKIPTMQVGR